MDAVRQCRACGCSQLSAHMTDDGPCWWVEPDLCSACVEHPAFDSRYPAYRLFDGVMKRQDVADGPWADLDQDAANEVLAQLDGNLVDRLASCLADAIDTPLMTGSDELGGFSSPLDIRLGFFKPELSERAAGLLEEAGR